MVDLLSLNELNMSFFLNLLHHHKSVVSFTNDMVEIYLDGLCNTVDRDFAQTEQYNLEDSLVRFGELTLFSHFCFLLKLSFLFS